MTLEMTMRQVDQTDRLKIDRLMLGILLAHLPFTMFLAPWGMGTGSFAVVASLLVAAVGVLGFMVLRGQRAFGVLIGALFMLMSAILIQAQLGRIEMHFHIFAALALMLIYRDWLTVVVPAGVIAVHHLLLNGLQMQGASLGDMPITLFNYGEPLIT
jgi:methyl-accepting chemotaxis protein